MHFDSTNGLPRPSLTYKNQNSSKSVPPPIYSRQQQPVDEGAYIRALQAIAVVERPQPTHVALYKPTAIFHGIDKKTVSHSVQQAPTTPLNLRKCASCSSPPCG